MDYGEALKYLSGFTDYEAVSGAAFTKEGYSLAPVEEVLRRLGDPHLAARTVHIAGTKGKGSVAAMVASVLSAAGYRTGLYTSPHLHSLRERIRVEGRLISQEELASLATETQPCLEKAAAAGDCARQMSPNRLTFFEVLTVLAFAYFQKQRVDIQVLEVGMGGRLDATNVACPQVCVITPISLDHMSVLGGSLAEIAREKAGIIKPGSVVVVAPQEKEAAAVIAKTCSEKGARPLWVGKDSSWQGKGDSPAYGFCRQSFLVRGERADYALEIPLAGDFQRENAAVAVAALEQLAASGIAVSPQDVVQGMKEVVWPGRLQVLQEEPLLLVDGAHNVASARRLVEEIKNHFPHERIFLVLGMSRDKDVAGIAEELAALSPRVIAVRSKHPRSASPEVIAAQFARRNMAAETAGSVALALRRALALAGRRDMICLTGSLFVVAEALEETGHALPD